MNKRIISFKLFKFYQMFDNYESDSSTISISNDELFLTYQDNFTCKNNEAMLISECSMKKIYSLNKDINNSL